MSLLYSEERKQQATSQLRKGRGGESCDGTTRLKRKRHGSVWALHARRVFTIFCFVLFFLLLLLLVVYQSSVFLLVNLFYYYYYFDSFFVILVLNLHCDSHTIFKAGLK